MGSCAHFKYPTRVRQHVSIVIIIIIIVVIVINNIVIMITTIITMEVRATVVLYLIQQVRLGWTIAELRAFSIDLICAIELKTSAFVPFTPSPVTSCSFFAWQHEG